MHSSNTNYPQGSRPMTSLSGVYTSQGHMVGPSMGWTPSKTATSTAAGNTTGGYASHQQTVQSERVLSSNIVGETVLGPVPQEENVQYVEVPVIEEVVKHVPKKEYIEVEKRVPRYEYEWVERVVEVPQVHIVDKAVEVPQIQEVICHVPVKQVVEVPREVVRRIPKIETRIVEKQIEVPGEVIEVPKPYLVDNRVVVPRYIDKQIPTVVAQKLQPIITESETDFVDVDLKEYNPYLVPVDVYVPRPVSRQLIASSRVEEHRVVTVPVGQFNGLIRQMNGHLSDGDLQEFLAKDQRGAIPIVPSTAAALVSPVSNEWEATNIPGSLRCSPDAPSGPITTPCTTGFAGSTTTSYQKTATSIAGASAGQGLSTSYLTPATQGLPSVGYLSGGGTTASKYTMSSRQICTPTYPMYSHTTTSTGFGQTASGFGQTASYPQTTYISSAHQPASYLSTMSSQQSDAAKLTKDSVVSHPIDMRA